MVALADPHSTPVEQLIDGLGGVPVLGGFAGLGGRGAARLFTNGGCAEEGAVGIVLEGLPRDRDRLAGRAADRPRARRHGRRGQPRRSSSPAARPSSACSRWSRNCPLTERLLLENGLLIGLVIDENRPEHGLGDFLVRGVLGADPETGALAIGDVPRVGQTVRLHVRDARSASRELDELLARQAAGRRLGSARCSPATAAAATCSREADHDAGAVARLLGSDAVAGCFCQGELGPVGGRTFVHGFTASVALW